MSVHWISLQAERFHSLTAYHLEMKFFIKTRLSKSIFFFFFKSAFTVPLMQSVSLFLSSLATIHPSYETSQSIHYRPVGKHYHYSEERTWRESLDDCWSQISFSEKMGKWCRLMEFTSIMPLILLFFFSFAGGRYFLFRGTCHFKLK